MVSFQLALVPMINYSFSSLFSLFATKRIAARFQSRYSPFLIGVAFLGVGIVPLLFLTPSVRWPVYLCSGLVGVSFSLFLNTSISSIVSLLTLRTTSSETTRRVEPSSSASTASSIK